MKRLLMSTLLIIVFLFIITGCKPKEVEVKEPKLHMISGQSYENVAYPQTLWERTVAEGVVFCNLSALEETMAIFSDYDQEEGVLSIVRLDQWIKIDMQAQLIYMNGKQYSAKGRVELIDGEPWLAINYFEDAFGIEIRKDMESKQLLLKDRSKTLQLASVIDQADLLERKEDQWQTVGRLANEEAFVILDQVDNYIEVFTDNFDHGYLLKDKIGDSVEEPVEKEPFLSNYQQQNQQIFLAWDQNYQRQPTEEVYGAIEHLNVLSPSWLTYTNVSGDIKNRISKDYMNWASQRKIDVWVMVTNDFDPDRTHEILKHASTRETAIENLMQILIDNHVKGLNIDFENIYLEDKNKLVQFVAELTARCHEADITVSMDVTMMGGSDNWSKCYDRAKLGDIVDYLVIMAYDQHWASSPVSGTVAGISWVEEGLNAFLEMVPHDKIILGMPLYTRVWRETPSRETVNAMEVKSKAITMAASQRIIDEKALNPLWDAESGQYYVAYIEEQTLYKIWHEDFKSLNLKAALIKDYDLGGAAVWRRGYEAEGTWAVIYEAVKE